MPDLLSHRQLPAPGVFLVRGGGPTNIPDVRGKEKPDPTPEQIEAQKRRELVANYSLGSFPVAERAAALAKLPAQIKDNLDADFVSELLSGIRKINETQALALIDAIPDAAFTNMWNDKSSRLSDIERVLENFDLDGTVVKTTRSDLRQESFTRRELQLSLWGPESGGYADVTYGYTPFAETKEIRVEVLHNLRRAFVAKMLKVVVPTMSPKELISAFETVSILRRDGEPVHETKQISGYCFGGSTACYEKLIQEGKPRYVTYKTYYTKKDPDFTSMIVDLVDWHKVDPETYRDIRFSRYAPNEAALGKAWIEAQHTD